MRTLRFAPESLLASLPRLGLPAWILTLLLGTLPGPFAAAQDFRITEFMAANSSGLRDEDGEYSDWIEIRNGGQQTASLDGWHLTDNPEVWTQWRFPALEVPAGGFVVVFASGKDRRDPAGRLHTNFKLEATGEFLALIRPDGFSPVSLFTPAFPRQLSDASYGIAMNTARTVLVPAEALARVRIPTDSSLGLTWTQPDYVDLSWHQLATPIGYALPPQPGDPAEPPPAVSDVSQPTDFIIPTSSNSPGGEGVVNAIDDNPATKYLNFDKLNAGLTLTFQAGPSVVTGLRVTSANDAPDRDPASFVLLGSDDAQTFTEVAQGALPDFTNRFTTVAVTFANSRAYPHYRLLFPTVRDATAAVAMQVAEIEFVGYAGTQGATFENLIHTAVDSLMFNRSASAYLRVPFVLESVPSAERLVLRAFVDDGFVAYLNGAPVLSFNAPDNPGFDAVSLTNRTRLAAATELSFDLTAQLALLHPGTNVLAIHALNDRSRSSDFLFRGQLETVGVAEEAAGYFPVPTPAAENGAALTALVEPVTASPGRGFFSAPVDVTLACATPNTTIRYTTDGTVPNATNGALYAAPVRLAATTALRAIALREDWLPSPAVTHSFLFLDDIVRQSAASTLAAGFPTNWADIAADYGLDPRVVGQGGQDNYGGKYTASLKTDLQSIPTVCLTVALNDFFGPLGIYAHPENRGGAWERPVSLELLYPDNTPGFQANAGVRIQGGAFRQFGLTLKKSFRLVFREKYGPGTLPYPFFGAGAAEAFDNFILRANSNDAWPYFGSSTLYIRDAFAMDTSRAMGHVASHSTFVHLYINGVYWGVYNPVERPDAAFSASYFGGDKDTWDALNQDSVPDGTADAWNAMLNLLSQGASRTEIYQQVQGNNPDGTRNPAYPDYLDVDNLIDYMILNFYVGNTDWPHRNWWAGRNRDSGDGFKFYHWDTETALGVTGLNADVTGASGAVAQPYAALRANADFRLRFADRAFQHFGPGGALYVNPASPAWDPAHPENNPAAARFAALAATVEQAMVGESARWGDQRGTGPFTRDEHWRVGRDGLLRDFFPYRSGIVLEQFRKAGLYPSIDPPVMNQRGGHVEPGFQLTLSAPGSTIYYTTNGADPRFPTTSELLSRYTLVSTNTALRVLAPSVANGGSTLGDSWRGGAEIFDDLAWQAGTNGVGYDQSTEYLPYFKVNLLTNLSGQNGSAFIRYRFYYEGTDKDRLNYMILRMQYDDGFVAYLNGVRIAGANDPADPLWDSVATQQHPDASAVVFEEFKVDDGLAALRTGRNILAIHALNISTTSSDFLLNAELIAGERLVTIGTNDALIYTNALPLTDLVTLKARAFNGSEWSALSQATFTVGTPVLSLSELHYHPTAPDAAELAAGWSDANQFEFVELCNSGTGSFNLDGVRFVDGIGFDFSTGAVTRLPAGGFVLLVKNRAAFEHRYGPGLPVAGEYTGLLSNSGEHLGLQGADDSSIADFTFGTRDPWPRAADGYGPSLEVVDYRGDLNLATTWRASTQPDGSPGAPNQPSPLTVSVANLGQSGLLLQFTARNATGYTVHYTDSLSAASWQVLQQGGPVTDGQVVALPLVPASGAQARFYRISIP